MKEVEVEETDEVHEPKLPDLAQLLLPIIKIPERKEESPFKPDVPMLSLEDSSNALFKSADIDKDDPYFEQQAEEKGFLTSRDKDDKKATPLDQLYNEPSVEQIQEQPAPDDSFEKMLKDKEMDHLKMSLVESSGEFGKFNELSLELKQFSNDIKQGIEEPIQESPEP